MSASSPRVLHLIASLDPRAGGTTTLLDALTRFQRQAGIDAQMVANFARGYDDSAVRRMRDAGVPVTLIGPNHRILAWHRDIAPTLARLIPNVDIVHIHDVWEEIQHRAAVIARHLGKPYVITPHGMLDPWSLAQGRLKKRLYMAVRLRRDLNAAAAIHFADEVERDLAAPLHLKPPAFVLRHLLDLNEFATLPPRGAFRQGHGIGQDQTLLLFLSRLHPKKGLDLLLPAVAQLSQPDVRLVLAGPGPADYVDQLRRESRQLGIESQLSLPGMLAGEARVAAFADADLFVLPSYQENFGLVVIESLAAGTPVVISDQVNIHRQITDHQLGEVVTTNVEALAQALRRWVGDPAARKAAAAKARPYVARHYNPQRIAAEWAGFYRSLIQA